MISKVHLTQAFASVLVASAAALLVAANVNRIQPGPLTVHEWGTFTSVAGKDGTAVNWDALGGKDDLPGFVNNFGYRGFKWQLRGTVRLETPVIYFYSPQPAEANIKVSFPRGLITEAYPKGEYQVSQKTASGEMQRLESNLKGIDTTLSSLTGGMEWRNVQIQPGSSRAFPQENGPSRYYAARSTDAAPITVDGQHEKFLFYRGEGRFDVPLTVRVTEGNRVLVGNRGDEPVPMVILFENHDGRIGFRNIGTLKGEMTVDRPALNGSFSILRRDLEAALVGHGLFAKEAQAMVETWRDSWFEEGTRLIYIVPSKMVDAVLPLQIEPAPAALARAFVGRVEVITPEAIQAVDRALTDNDQTTVDRYGRFLEPILTRILDTNPSRAREIAQARHRRNEWPLR